MVNTGSLEGRRILILEDDYMIAQDVADQLRKSGGQIVGPTPSVREAISLIDGDEQLDAAILDVNLGQEHSFPVAQILSDRGVPFLFSTGYNSGDIPADWQHVPVSMKPLRIVDVVRLLNENG